ncbi:winged helix-turn-helix domain-containing protein [Consotaella salsifontis]|uniref:Transposase n=1 Tax=Consotaella salsifontis TaxID=1365950 RepID=A0A1T4T9W0_9HYPH|nr:winged helix-turn-helix domain-containing protein [Consotaella salsifontis]SKA37350.1 Transposase [Consotaella salsifontis]
MALEISDRHSAGELRAMARRETNGRVGSRMLAIANALDGMSRADAARAAGMDRQTLRDWVVRYEAEGVAGLRDRPKGHPAPRLTEGELATLSNVIFLGPDPETDGISTWTLSELCRWIEAHFAKSLHPASLSRILRQNGFSRQKTRPSHPLKDPKAQERFQKRGSARP